MTIYHWERIQIKQIRYSFIYLKSSLNSVWIPQKKHHIQFCYPDITVLCLSRITSTSVPMKPKVFIYWAVCFRSDMMSCSIFLYSWNETVQIFALLLFVRAKLQECARHLGHSNGDESVPHWTCLILSDVLLLVYWELVKAVPEHIS